MFDIPASAFAYYVVVLGYSVTLVVWLFYGLFSAAFAAVPFGRFATGCGLACVGFLSANLALWFSMLGIGDILRLIHPRASAPAVAGLSPAADCAFAWFIVVCNVAVLVFALRLPFRQPKSLNPAHERTRSAGKAQTSDH